MSEYIIEFKIAVKCRTDAGLEEALDIAAQNCELLYGFKPSIWFADICEIDESQKIVKKYFYNPNSSTFLEIE